MNTLETAGELRPVENDPAHRTGFTPAGGTTETPQTALLDSANTDAVPADTTTDQVLTFDGPVSGYFNSTTDHDWIRVHLDAGITYTIAMTQASYPSNTAAQLDLVTASGQVLTSAIYATGPGLGNLSGAVVTYTPTTSGTYYLSASSPDGVNASYSIAFRDLIANTTPSSTGLAADAHVHGILESHIDSDVYAVTLTAGVAYDFVMSSYGTDALPDPYLTLFGATGEIAGSNDDVDATDGFYDAVIHYTATTTGTYYLSAQSSSLVSSSQRSGTYDLHFGVSADAYGPQGPVTGYLSEGQSVVSKIDTVGDQDWFTVTLQAGYIYTFNLDGTGATPLADPYLRLLDNVRNAVKADDDDGGAGHNSQLSFFVQTSGTYFLSAQSFNNGTPDTETGGYTLTMAQKAVATVDTIVQDTTTTAMIVTGSPVDGKIDTPLDMDWYAVDLAAGTGYDFDLAGQNGFDPTLYVYDLSGNLIAQNADFGAGTDAHLDFEASTSGRFYLGVAGTRGVNYGSYTLSATAGDRPLLTQSIDWGTKLNPAGGVVKVYFAQAGETYDSETSLGWNDYEIQQAMTALATYSRYVDLTFIKTTDAAQADFKLVTADDLGNGVLGYMGPPGTDNAGIGVFARNSVGWSKTAGGALDQGGVGFETLVHEFGHGLGLAHPFDGGGGATIMTGVLSGYSNGGDYFDYGYQNQGVYTVMSYNDGWPGGPLPHTVGYTSGFETTPMAVDVAALQAKYGANTATGAGDTTYTLGVPAKAHFESLWDAAGIDVLSAETVSSNLAVNLDLRPASMYYTDPVSGGAVSYIAGVTYGIVIDQGVTIENAIGHDGTDTITGNDAANIVTGLGGNDSLYGNAGADTLFGGAGNDYLDGGAGVDQLYGGAGSDTYILNSGTDVVSETTAGGVDDGGTDTVMINDPSVGEYALPAFVENVNVSGVTNIALDGNSLNNHLTGNVGDNTITGGAGSDIIDGGLGTDTAVYTFASASATLYRYDRATWVYDRSSHDLDQLFNVEQIQFDDKAMPAISIPAFDPLIYLASYGDLLQGFGLNTVAATQHFLSYGLAEGRTPGNFDAAEYLASNSDLARGFGYDLIKAEQHYIEHGYAEHRQTNSFDAAGYLASNFDLATGFGYNLAAAREHYIEHGIAEHRQTSTFDAAEYLASNFDLATGFGYDLAAAREHYIEHGIAEHRQTSTFDAAEYLASNLDLALGFGFDLAAAKEHYLGHGIAEHRQTSSFDAVEYIASNPDLIVAFGADPTAGAAHYVQFGLNEHRATSSFDAAQYLANYPDLVAAFGHDLHAAELHYIQFGYLEHRTDALI